MEVGEDVLQGKSLEKLLRKLLTDHSSRRINYLYWNAIRPEEQVLNFVNLSGKELIRINNSDLIYRVVKVKDPEEWKQIFTFIQNYIVDPNNPEIAHIIRVDYLITYLKNLEFDPTKITVKRERFGTGFIYSDDPDPKKKKPLCTIDHDIQSVFLIDKLYQKYSQMLFQNKPEWEITPIKERYLNDPDFTFVLNDLGITLPVTEALDTVSKKFIIVRSTDPVCELDQIYIHNGLSTVVSRFTCSDLCIITIRVYLQLFIKKFTHKRKK